MDVAYQGPGMFDLERELTKLVESPDWEEIVWDLKTPLIVFANKTTGQIKALGDQDAARIALDGWNESVNSVLRENRAMNRAQRRRARRK